MTESITFKDLGLKKKKYEEVEVQIKKRIQNGTLKLHERLPTEREMADQFGVSRMVIREAVRSLELAGFILVKKGAHGGIFVAQNYDNSLMRSVTNFIDAANESIENLVEIRMLIETNAAFCVAQEASPNEVDLLGSLLKNAEKSFSNGENIRSFNIRFHRMLLGFYHNPLLVAVGETVMLSIMDKIRETSNEELSLEHLNFHKKILSAIEVQDGEQAKKIMQEDIISLARSLEIELTPMLCQFNSHH